MSNSSMFKFVIHVYVCLLSLNSTSFKKLRIHFNILVADQTAGLTYLMMWAF